MSSKTLSQYKPGLKILVSDHMQEGYEYVLTALPGEDFDPEFKPELTPQEMLEHGVFEGKYLNDCTKEFPIEWYKNAKISISKQMLR